MGIRCPIPELDVETWMYGFLCGNLHRNLGFCMTDFYKIQGIGIFMSIVYRNAYRIRI